MTTDEMTAAIVDLEHALIDTWEWERLYNLGRATAELVGTSEVRSIRQMDQLRTACLVTSYTRALDIITDRLRDIERGPVADALLESLLENVLYKTGAGSLQTLMEQVEDVGALFFPEAPMVHDEEAYLELWRTTNDYSSNWSCVAGELAFFGSKVADHIRHYLSTGVQRAATATTEQVRWIGTAALFGQLIHELAAAGYLAPPQRREKGVLVSNWTAAARTIHAAFDIRPEGGEPVSLNSLTQALKLEGDRDIKGGKAAFKITPRQR